MADTNELDMTWPASGIIEVTPSDTEDLPKTSRALYVQPYAHLAVIMHDGSEGVIRAAQGWLWVRVSRIKETGTTEGVSITAFY